MIVAVLVRRSVQIVSLPLSSGDLGLRNSDTQVPRYRLKLYYIQPLWC
jgi:hypothetical protein